MRSSLIDSHRRPRRGWAAVVGAAALVFLAADCDTGREALTKSRARKVEKGLLRAIYIKGTKPEKLSLDVRMQFYRVPGAALAVMDGNVLEWAGSYGVRDAHSNEPVTDDTMFQAGDLARPLAAAATLQLVDKSRLALAADMGTSLRRAGALPEDSAAKAGPTLAEILTRADGFSLIAPLLERETSSSFPVLMNEAVFGPLGLKNSTFARPLPEAMRINAASGHGRDGRPIEGKWTDSQPPAPGGLWASPSDLLAFASDILRTATGREGKILSAAQARAMLTAQIENRAFGFEIEGTAKDVRVHLRGRTSGFTCSLDVYPYKGQGAVIMTNSDNGFLLTDEILRSLSAAYEWPDFKPQERPLYRLDPSIYRQYVGRYEISPDYILDVSYEDYYLIIRPTGQAPTRFYVESQTFFFSIDPYVRIQFLSDRKGDITGLLLWQEDFKQEAKKTG